MLNYSLSQIQQHSLVSDGKKFYNIGPCSSHPPSSWTSGRRRRHHREPRPRIPELEINLIYFQSLFWVTKNNIRSNFGSSVYFHRDVNADGIFVDICGHFIWRQVRKDVAASANIWTTFSVANKHTKTIRFFRSFFRGDVLVVDNLPALDFSRHCGWSRRRQRKAFSLFYFDIEGVLSIK